MPASTQSIVAVVAMGTAASALVWCAALLRLARQRGRALTELSARLLAAPRPTPAPTTTPTGARAVHEEAMQQAQKLEALGRVTASVAHDFNNLLTAIHGYADFLLADLAREDPRRDDAREIKRTATRASALTGQLLAFSRRREPSLRLLDLSAVVADLDRMLRRIVGESVTLTVAPADAPALVRADPGQLEQVLLNLVVNASDAMPDGGTITIAARPLHVVGDVPGPATAAGALPAGRWVALTVRDTGMGMDAATRARIFEPFFTTKAPGEGTGLGLATVHGIVRDAGGAIGVDSAPGAGTAFTIYLPEQASADVGGYAGTQATMRTLAPRGCETVLLVEDDEQVRALFARVLRRYGYAVLEARDGEEGLQLADSHADALALAIVDVGLPRRGGRVLCDALAARHPQVVVRFVTGYGDDDLARLGGLPPDASVLRKPVAPPVLLAAVREALDARPVSAAA